MRYTHAMRDNILNDNVEEDTFLGNVDNCCLNKSMKYIIDGIEDDTWSC